MTEISKYSFFNSFYETIKKLSDEDAGKLIKAMNEYVFEDKEPQLEGVLDIIFPTIKANLHSDKINRLEGQKGGRPKKEMVVIKDEKPEEEKTENPHFKKIKTPLSENKNHPFEKTKTNVNVNVNDECERECECEFPPISPPGDVVEKTKNQNGPPDDFIDFDFVKSEYENGDFDFDLERFWNYWKNKGVRRKELSSKLIFWDIRHRDKLKLQGAMRELNASRVRCQEEDEGEFYV